MSEHVHGVYAEAIRQWHPNGFAVDLSRVVVDPAALPLLVELAAADLALLYLALLLKTNPARTVKVPIRELAVDLRLSVTDVQARLARLLAFRWRGGRVSYAFTTSVYGQPHVVLPHTQMALGQPTAAVTLQFPAPPQQPDAAQVDALAARLEAVGFDRDEARDFASHWPPERVYAAIDAGGGDALAVADALIEG